MARGASAGRHSHERRSRKSRRLRPAVDGLEARIPLALYGFTAEAAPAILLPTGLYTPVSVTGSVSETDNKIVPSATFQVVDEYSQVEPSGHLTLRKSGDTTYDFSFTVLLKASVAASDTAGRQYYIVAGAREASVDSQSSTGKVLPVLVLNPSSLRHTPRPPSARQHSPRIPSPRTAHTPAPLGHRVRPLRTLPPSRLATHSS